MISSWTEPPSRAAVTLSSVRSALATLPLRPMTLPMSSSATCSSMTVPSSSSTSVTLTESGSSTSDFATYSTSSFALMAALLLLCRQDAGAAEQARDGVRGQCALGEPRLGLVGVDGQLDRICARVVVPERLDRAAVPRAAGVGDDHAIARLLRGADAGQADANGHAVPPGLALCLRLSDGDDDAGAVARAVGGRGHGDDVKGRGVRCVLLLPLGELLGRKEGFVQVECRRDADVDRCAAVGEAARRRRLELRLVGEARARLRAEDPGHERIPDPDEHDAALRRERQLDL